MQPLFSIVMPVYKVEAYLEKAVRSIAGQTEEDWELILVDDASPDGCGALCDRLKQEDSRISVIHLSENGGLSCARNVGMKAARGRYLMFMDSDDWVEAELLERLKECVSGELPPQMIVWGVTEEHFDAKGTMIHSRKVFATEETYDTAERTRYGALELEATTLLGYAWNKLYDMELIRKTGAEFEKVPLIEDILFNLRILGAVERMDVLEITPYHYARRTSGSLTHRFLPYYYELSMRRVEEMLNLYDGWGMKEAAAQTLAPIYARYVLSALQRNCDPQAGMNHSARRKFAGKILESGLFSELLPYLKRGRALTGMIGRLLAMRNVSVCLMAGRGVYLVSTKMKRLFVRLSGKREGA